ncbi:MAG: inositol monophosphatase family protein [Pseudomonadota bacterium]
MTQPGMSSDAAPSSDGSAGGPAASLADRLDAAGRIARQAGRHALALRRDLAGLEVEEKGLQDFVTRADVEVEALIRDALLGRFPDDGFLGEEDSRRPPNDGHGTWVVDPIDGTSNYIRGIRHWGVSIAYVRDGRVEVGVIHDAPNDALYAAGRGGGASRDGLPITVSKTADMTKALAFMGMSRRMGLDDYLGDIRRLTEAGADYRRLGSAAIGLARIAEGVADLYFEAHLNSWDALAGMLIVAEAGGSVRTPDLQVMLDRGGPVLADNGRLGAQIGFLADRV